MTQKTVLIAEIGATHNGSIEMAKTIIRVAKESGADIISGLPATLDVIQCVALIQYAREIGIDFFFAVTGREYEGLKSLQRWNKFTAEQSKNNPRQVERFDRSNVFVCVNAMTLLPIVHYSQVIFEGRFDRDPNLNCLEFLAEFYGRPIGYSDRTEGIDWCLRANRIYGARIIEKHFTLNSSTYGALPQEFEQLAKGIK